MGVILNLKAPNAETSILKLNVLETLNSQNSTGPLIDDELNSKCLIVVTGLNS
ncbi:hypothetical protein TASI_1270 [Taylorella asinigenitalis MCE3]|uniref:Uncharacterized protein n=1 Tax=Taylorella asinigenitalis (strain MCE3) TaxID=1008459 RepID=G4QC44_TAYAM|nr:hypothetical protein TASI_1270 [Taylorella asinigenitalis MCE3]